MTFSDDDMADHRKGRRSLQSSVEEGKDGLLGETARSGDTFLDDPSLVGTEEVLSMEEDLERHKALPDSFRMPIAALGRRQMGACPSNPASSVICRR